jgi:hypothetical protein
VAEMMRAPHTVWKGACGHYWDNPSSSASCPVCAITSDENVGMGAMMLCTSPYGVCARVCGSCKMRARDCIEAALILTKSAAPTPEPSQSESCVSASPPLNEAQQESGE